MLIIALWSSEREKGGGGGGKATEYAYFGRFKATKHGRETIR